MKTKGETVQLPVGNFPNIIIGCFFSKLGDVILTLRQRKLSKSTAVIVALPKGFSTQFKFPPFFFLITRTFYSIISLTCFTPRLSGSIDSHFDGLGIGSDLRRSRANCYR